MLCGRGEIQLNGQPAEQLMHILPRFSGYVPQHDKVMETLTVKEILDMTARLRLPASIEEGDRDRYVEGLTQELGLGDVMHCRVGGEQNRGISGF